jgi:MFS transporter, DHA2 family, multidrug resistance protein
MAETGPPHPGEWTPARSVAGKRNPWAIVGVISIATFMTVLDTSIANVALQHIAGTTGSSYDEATWVLTTFLVAQAVITPISGWLADVIGRKRYYMISVAVFTIASGLCGIAQTLPFLIIARVIQGVGGGGLAPVEQSMLVDTFPPEKRGLAFAAYGMVVIAGPVLGPSLGGWLTDNYSWHWVFLINLPFGVLSLILVQIFVDEPEAVRRRTEELRRGGLKVDFGGFLLAGTFLGATEITLDRGQEQDWFGDPMIRTTAVLAALSIVLFIPWELLRRDPIIKIRMFANRNFAVANVLLLVVGMVLFGTTQFIPQLLQQVLGYTATDAGFAMTAGGVATVLTMPLSGLLTNRIDSRLLVAFAFASQSFAMWYFAQLSPGLAFHDAARARTLQAMGIPFLFVPISIIGYVGLRPEESNQASALMNVVRNFGGTIGIALGQTMIARRSQWHQARLAETLNPLNPNYVHGTAQIAQALQNAGQSSVVAPQQALRTLYGQLVTQANFLAYIDVFHTFMLITVVVIPLLLLMRPPKLTPAKAAGEGHLA